MYTNLGDMRELIQDGKEPDKEEIEIILEKSKCHKRLEVDEIASLLKTERNPVLFKMVLSAAKQVRDMAIGRIVYLPVPLYVSNVCVNMCDYCGYNSRITTERRRLSQKELGSEVEQLTKYGYRMIELVAGEDSFFFGRRPKFNVEKMVEYVRIAKEGMNKKGDNEIVLNIPPLDENGFKRLKNAGTEVIVQWQETFDKKRYKELHPEGTPKSDFDFRIGAYDRMLNAGIRNAGIGILFGLSDWRFDVISLVNHVYYLQDRYRISPVIGIPRFKEASGVTYKPGKFKVNDSQLKLAVAVYRLSIPESTIFISTRENYDLMFKLLDECGGGNLFATRCSVAPGGYLDSKDREKVSKRTEGQFHVYDLPLEDIKNYLIQRGYIPSFGPPIDNRP